MIKSINIGIYVANMLLKEKSEWWKVKYEKLSDI